MPLLFADLPVEQSEALLAAIDDPNRFGGEYRLPTVSRSDADFSNTRMWRGPIWLSTNYLVIEALERRGLTDAARELARQSIELVRVNDGPYEYYQPDNGTPSPSAVACFGWTAALTVDLAVRFFGADL